MKEFYWSGKSSDTDACIPADASVSGSWTGIVLADLLSSTHDSQTWRLVAPVAEDLYLYFTMCQKLCNLPNY